MLNKGNKDKEETEIVSESLIVEMSHSLAYNHKESPRSFTSLGKGSFDRSYKIDDVGKHHRIHKTLGPGAYEVPGSFGGRDNMKAQAL